LTHKYGSLNTSGIKNIIFCLFDKQNDRFPKWDFGNVKKSA